MVSPTRPTTIYDPSCTTRIVIDANELPVQRLSPGLLDRSDSRVWNQTQPFRSSEKASRFG
jgi:hypothetical protein